MKSDFRVENILFLPVSLCPRGKYFLRSETPSERATDFLRLRSGNLLIFRCLTTGSLVVVLNSLSKYFSLRSEPTVEVENILDSVVSSISECRVEKAEKVMEEDEAECWGEERGEVEARLVAGEVPGGVVTITSWNSATSAPTAASVVV